jgi:hypothetical protein
MSENILTKIFESKANDLYENRKYLFQIVMICLKIYEKNTPGWSKIRKLSYILLFKNRRKC